jgi:hypothetical protein
MSNEKQKTAVEWFSNKSWKLKIQLENKEISVGEYAVTYVKLVDKAKEMEKAQIAKAFDDGDYNYHYSKKTGNDFENGEEYFEELYGGNK